MPDVSRMVASPPDPKARLIAIFAGAVLLPSIALSVMSLYSVPTQAEGLKATLKKRQELILFYVEKDLAAAARARALEAARAVGTERLLEGRPETIAGALRRAGLDPGVFETLRLDAASTRARGADAPKDRDLDMLKDALNVSEAQGEASEDAVQLTAGESELIGELRFKLSCSFAHDVLIRQYFEKDFLNPGGIWVVRVAEPSGRVLYETAPTPDDRFDYKRVMTSPSFKGVKLLVRAKERSIDEEIQRFTVAKMAMIAFIDALLGAGLLLVYNNVRRELHLSRLKSDFVANVSHELKTPLALIRLFAETLELGRVPSDDRKKQYYQVINKESQRLAQLINNILDFSRIEAGRKEYRFAKTDVGRIVQDVVEAYRFQIEQQGFQLEVHVADDLPEIEVDKEAVGQALLNLVNNAVKYSRDEKWMRIEARREGDKVLISVADKGIGIAKSEHLKIFEKFYRAEDSLVHETKGSGLGLSLVKHIMEAHGGGVMVDSAPGKGSTFTLALEIHKKAAVA
jgi:signal transduction histidine kinase